MCGIYGMFSLTGARLQNPQLLEPMGVLLRHRGPDSSGHIATPTAALGAERLQIIDPTDRGNQPFKDPDENIWLAGNGEIYNSPTLRRRYSGYPFQSRSDIECALPAFLSDELAALEGKFAFIVWDARNSTLTLMRDRAGESPLFYARVGEEVVVASELQAILLHPGVSKKLDDEAISQYFTHGYPIEPRTMFADILRVESGTVTTLSATGTAVKRYWEVENIRETPMGPDRAEQLLDRSLNDAVARQLNVSAPVGVFLSGGLDSALITALVSKHNGPGVPTFTARFVDKNFDESGHSREVARRFKTEHTEVVVDDDSLLRAFEFATDKIAEPISDPALLPTLLLAEQAATSLKIVLTGEGADELFGGYPPYPAHQIVEPFQGIPGSIRHRITSTILNLPSSQKRVPLAFMLKRFVKGADKPWIERHAGWFGLGAASVPVNRFNTLPQYGDRVGRLEGLEAAMKLDYLTYLRDQLLVKIDRASMSHGLEARSPFLDTILTQLAFSIPSSLRVRGFTTKWILKQVAKRYLPALTIRRRKHGLSVPVGALINGPLREETDRLLSPRQIQAPGLLRVGNLQAMLYEHRAGIANHARTLWATIIFQRWHERWVMGDA